MLIFWNIRKEKPIIGSPVKDKTTIYVLVPTEDATVMFRAKSVTNNFHFTDGTCAFIYNFMKIWLTALLRVKVVSFSLIL